MVEAHVAGLACLRLPRFLDTESVACVAGVAGGYAETAALGAELFDLCHCLQANFVTPTTALHAFHQRYRLRMRRRHGFHRCPCDGMLSAFELFHPVWMAASAGIRSWDLSL